MAIGPFVSETEFHLTPNPSGFSKRFNDAIKDLDSTAAFAVVDLTDGIPQYGVSAQEYAEKHVFSVAKLAPWFAAFRLRERLQSQFSGDSAATVKDLVANVKKAWGSEVHSKGKLMGVDDFPNIENIFELSPDGKAGTWQFEFKGRTPENSWNDLTDLWTKYPTPSNTDYLIPENLVEKMPFWDRLRLAIRMSENNCAGSIANDVGLAYMLGALMTEGFYSREKHGLWLSTLYGYKHDYKYGGAEGSKKEDITAGGTARSLATFMTLLAQKKLVDKDASEDMLDILSVTHGGFGSWFVGAGGLSKHHVTHSKVGLGTTSSEVAIVQYTVKRPTKPVPPGPNPPHDTLVAVNKWKVDHPIHIKYLVVALQVAANSLVDVINAIDPFIQSEHVP